MGVAARPLADRFWEKVSVGPAEECWEWTGSTSDTGYGNISTGLAKPRMRSAHRVAWELRNGPIRDGLWVLHRCDNRPCVNPAHLFLGTDTDNNRDMARKGRVDHQLTPQQVREIRRLWPGSLTMAELGHEFGVSKSAVWSVIHGRTWAWLA